MQTTFECAALILALTVCTQAASVNTTVSPPPPLSLRAVVVPRKALHYEIPWFRKICSYTEMACVVKNVSSIPVTISTNVVDWHRNWSIDGPFAHIVQVMTTADIPTTVILQPGESYEKIVPITFNDTKVGRRVTFRMRFETNPDSHINFTNPPSHYRRPISHVVLSAPLTVRVPERAAHCR